MLIHHKKWLILKWILKSFSSMLNAKTQKYCQILTKIQTWAFFPHSTNSGRVQSSKFVWKVEGTLKIPNFEILNCVLFLKPKSLNKSAVKLVQLLCNLFNKTFILSGNLYGNMGCWKVALGLRITKFRVSSYLKIQYC
jgi:hypothetical protein